jgi:ethanolamine ammonia-lyase large subunit
MEGRKERVCTLLKELESLIEKYKEEIPAPGMALFHVRRAMELVKCSPAGSSPANPNEKELLEKGYLVE